MREIQQLMVASGIAVLTGGFLGASFPREEGLTPSLASASNTRDPSHGARPDFTDESGNKPSNDRKVLMRRLVAECGTAELWEWLRSSYPQGGEWLDVVAEELVDREGWQAWSFVRGMANEGNRGDVGELILAKLAERDPWKAYEVWKESRAEFADPQDPHWGSGVLDFVIKAAAATSGEKLVEVLQQMTAEESEWLMTLEFAGDFDFRKVLDSIVKADRVPLTVPENLLPEWAKGSPVEAAGWLVENPEFLKVEHQEYAANHAIERIASSEGSIEARHEALAILSGLPASFLDQAWDVLAGNSKGTIDFMTLDSATRTDRRERYLIGALLETRVSDHIDSSWDQVPLEERRLILERAAGTWADQGSASAVETRARTRWRERVAAAWGITP